MKTNQLMLAVNSNDMESEIFADLALAFADRPLYHYGMTVVREGWRDPVSAEGTIMHYYAH
jgi:hypothetical protein